MSAILAGALGYLVYVGPYVRSRTLVGPGATLAPLGVVAFALPYAIAASGLIRAPGARWGFARGLAVGGGVLAAVLALAATVGRVVMLLMAASLVRAHVPAVVSIVCVAGLAVLSPIHDVLTPVLRAQPIGPLLLVFFLGAQIGLARAAGRLRSAAAGRTARRGPLAGAWSLVGAALPLCVGIPVQHLETRGLYRAVDQDVRAYEGVRPDQLAAREALLRVTGCVQAAAARDSAAGYPRDLSAVGPNGTGCLADSLVAGRAGPYRLVYRAAVPTAAGRIAAYWVSAQFPAGAAAAVRRASSNRPIGYVTDQTGVLYQTTMFAPEGSSSGPDTTLVAPMIGNVVRSLLEMRECLDGAYRRGLQPAGGFPRELHDRPLGNCLLNGNASNATMVSPMPFAQVRLTYVAGPVIRPDSVARTFVLEARPVSYPLTGARSFLVDEDGRIHATAADRAARRDDPLVPQCEIDVGNRCQVAP